MVCEKEMNIIIYVPVRRHDDAAASRRGAALGPAFLHFHRNNTHSQGGKTYELAVTQMFTVSHLINMYIPT